MPSYNCLSVNNLHLNTQKKMFGIEQLVYDEYLQANRQPSTNHAKASTVEDGRSVLTFLALRLKYLV